MATQFGPQPYTGLTREGFSWSPSSAGQLSINDASLTLNPSNVFSDWLGPVSKGLTLAGSILGGVNMFQASGNLKSQASQFRQRAALALEQGFQTGIDIQQEGDQVLGTMTATFGKSGSLLEGSPLLVIADTQNRIQQNVERVIQQGRIEQAAFLRTARQLEKQARGAKLGGIGKIIGGVASVIPGLQPAGLAISASSGVFS